ncbi:glycoside hydrolase family 43 protein [Rutstroemia sp. NJR-2017a BBW]|nr:glycoside hydrolase family 43 protein [Rutstroemia sp. NJR-2017a BBW]
MPAKSTIQVKFSMYTPIQVVILLNTLATFVAGQYISFSSTSLNVKLNVSSQTLASLQPRALPSFDFSPFDVLSQRSANGNYHLGDITIRYRQAGANLWTNVDSAAARKPVISTGGSTSNLSPTLPSGLPLNITRIWSTNGADVALNFSITNTGNKSIEIGSLGFPIEFNSIFTGRTALATQQTCSFVDPNIGLDGGYLRVAPLSGTGPALVVTPLGHTPFEAWRFLQEDTQTPLSYQSQTFEGFYSWDVYTLAYAQNEWSSAVPWNPATSVVLAPGKSISHGLRFSVASDIPSIESTIETTGTPLAVGVPGYIIPRDLTAQLTLRYNSMVSSIETSPPGALTFSQIAAKTYSLTPSSAIWGRVRVTIRYANNLTQTIHYYITESAPETVHDLGQFLTTNQWFSNTSDPFHRAPSVLSYDRSVNQLVLQDPRAWIPGLSDEAGAGSYLAATMKQAASPNAGEVAKLEDFITKTLWGSVQNSDYSVRKSVFFYEPSAVSYNYDPAIDWTQWWSWNKANAYATDRAYDYVHVTAAYWSLYRVARYYPDIVKKQTWQWYLNQAYNTVIYVTSKNVPYVDVGMMGETVFGKLLDDLKNEGLTSQATMLEAAMKKRALLWDTQAVPFGSEMAWDSTGQEGVYYWAKYFNLTATTSKTLNTILGYMPTVSHWCWNGNARRYWDNIPPNLLLPPHSYGGKIQRYERQGHHYGSGLNALPLLSHFESHPNLTHLLRIGFGGISGPLSNIDQGGFASASFHTWPDTLIWDPYSGDYGPNFLGLVLGSGTWVLDDQEFGLGLVAFGGLLTLGSGNAMGWTVEPRDPVRRRVFIAQMGVRVEVDAGAIEKVVFDGGEKVEVTVAPSVKSISTMAKANSTILRVVKTAQVGGVGSAKVVGLQAARGGWSVDLRGGSVVVEVAFT